MSRNNENFSRKEFIDALHSLITSTLSCSQIVSCSKPQAYLLGGQSGAGKTTLHDILRVYFNDNVIVINGDEYRSLHPRYRELDLKYGPECVKYTAPWAGKMTEALIDAFSTMGYNLVIEGTLRTSEVPLATAKLLRERGYTVSLACMAVKPEISLVSCQIRYERMRLAGTVPRATDPAHHNAIVQDIVNNISELEQSGLFEQVYLYNRAGECLYPEPTTQNRNKTPLESAEKVLKEVLFGSWTSEEKLHYEYLNNELSKFKNSSTPM